MSENNNEQQKRKTTYGSFNVTGFITIDDKTFTINAEGKNNKNWISNVFNPKVETPEGKSLFMNFRDGFDKVKGKKIFATIKDTNDQMEVTFADRNKDIILNQIDDKSFIKVAFNKIKKINEQTQKEFETWDYKHFLTVYDVIALLKEKFPLGTKIKVQLMGKTKYQYYNGNISKNYDLQTFHLLKDDDTSECKFTFTQDILIENDSLDKSKWDAEGIIKINGKLLQKKKKGEYEILVLPMIIRADNPDRKVSYEKVIEKYFTVPEDIVRRLKVEGFYNSGYIAGNVTKEDLPDEAKELIAEEFYTEEEVFKMYANREKVDEMLIRRPHMVKGKDGDKPKIDYSDTDFTKKDFENLVVSQQEEEIEITEEGLDDNLLKELENL